MKGAFDVACAKDLMLGLIEDICGSRSLRCVILRVRGTTRWPPFDRVAASNRVAASSQACQFIGRVSDVAQHASRDLGSPGYLSQTPFQTLPELMRGAHGRCGPAIESKSI